MSIETADRVTKLNRHWFWLRARRVGMLATIGIAGIVWQGSWHQPLPSSEGRHLLGQGIASENQGDAFTASPSTTFRVASFNIHGCRGADGRFNPERTADALQGFDLVALNEVHGSWHWQRPHQVESLAHKLDMPWLFAPTEWRWWRNDFGNGLLCTMPIDRWNCRPLRGTRHKGYRNRVLVQLRNGPTTIHAIVTHLDRVQDTVSQLVEVTDEFLALPEPALLMGDLNLRRSDPELARILALPGVHDLVGESAEDDSLERIDWILGRGLRAIQAGVVETGASDHPLVWAEVGCP